MSHILKVALLLLFPFAVVAQQTEVGIFLGASGYSGDIARNNTRFTIGDLNTSVGIFGRKEINDYLAGRLGFTFGKISASDAESEIEGLRARNLSFRSNIFELSGVVEINPLGNNGYGDLVEPYVYAGVALFRFNPKASYNGQLVDLQPIGTEGQGMDGFGDPYSLTQVSIPMGIGVRFRITEQLRLGLDIGLRKTFTDYLDDVSGTYVSYDELMAGNGPVAAALGNRQGELTGEPVIVETGAKRGNSERQDWYYNAGLTLSYSFQGGGRWRSGRNIGCPMTIH